MERRFRLCSYAVLLGFCIGYKGEVAGSWLHWRLGDIKDIYTPVGHLFTMPATSSSYCSFACSKHAQCKWFGFSQSGSQCQGYSGTPNHLSATGFIPQSDTAIWLLDCSVPEYVYVEKINRCVKFQQTNMDWFTARVSCQADGADLLTVETEAVLEYLSDTVFDYSTNGLAWVGGYRNPSNLSSWLWVTGDTVNPFSGGGFWRPGDPNYHLDSEECMQAYPDVDGDGVKLVDNSCSYLSSSVCAL